MFKHEISKIINFTELLNEPFNSFCFNPSVAHWKDDLYLVCYRTFMKDSRNQGGLKNVDNKLKPNHPWLGWNFHPTYGWNETGFCIIRINEKNINIYKNLNDGNSISYFNSDTKILIEVMIFI